MTCEATTANTLRQFGLRLTKQRETIISALRHSDHHRTAPAIFNEIHPKHPNINPSTVYRTLTLFKKIGLISETDLGTGELTYAWLGSNRHHHLICHHCNEAIELGHDYMKTLQKRVMRDFGFSAAIDHFAVFGVCRTCRGIHESSTPK